MDCSKLNIFACESPPTVIGTYAASTLCPKLRLKTRTALFVVYSTTKALSARSLRRYLRLEVLRGISVWGKLFSRFWCNSFRISKGALSAICLFNFQRTVSISNSMLECLSTSCEGVAPDSTEVNVLRPNWTLAIAIHPTHNPQLCILTQHEIHIRRIHVRAPDASARERTVPTHRPRRPHTPLPPPLRDVDRRARHRRVQREQRRAGRARRRGRVARALLDRAGDGAADGEEGDVDVVGDEGRGRVGAGCAGDGGRVDGFVGAVDQTVGRGEGGGCGCGEEEEGEDCF